MTTGIEPRWLIVRLLARVPRVVLAVVGVTVITVADILLRSSEAASYGQFMRHAFLPLTALVLVSAGALQRCSWRQALVMAAIFAAAVGAAAAMEAVHLPSGVRLGACWLDVWLLGVVWAIGVAETVISGHRPRQAVPLVLAWTIAACLLHSMVMSSVRWTGASFELHSGKTISHWSWSSALHWPIFALLVWAAIWLVTRPSRQRRQWAGALGACLATVVLHTTFSRCAAYELAGWSLRGGGPFDKLWSVALLDSRGRGEDLRAIVEAVATADWSERIEPENDWRRSAIIKLSTNKDVASIAATRLAAQLRAKPSYDMASAVSDILVDTRTYEAVPILLRYQLARGSTLGLERLGMPEASLSILGLCPLDRPGFQVDDFAIPSERRSKLTMALGYDAGPMYSDWRLAAMDAIENAPRRLPPAIQAEVDREMACFEAYASAFNDWIQARNARVLLLAGDEIVARLSEVGYIPTDRREDAKRFRAILDAATAEMQVAKPNTDVDTIGIYEQEVEAYSQRVQAVIERFAEQPTTRTASAENP
jgi:hypothetical protein